MITYAPLEIPIFQSQYIPYRQRWMPSDPSGRRVYQRIHFLQTDPPVQFQWQKAFSQKNRQLIMVPIRTSKEADELNPEPGKTVDSQYASNPSNLHPICENLAATPRINAGVVFTSLFFGSSSSRQTSHKGYPLE